MDCGIVWKRTGFPPENSDAELQGGQPPAIRIPGQKTQPVGKDAAGNALGDLSWLQELQGADEFSAGGLPTLCEYPKAPGRLNCPRHPEKAQKGPENRAFQQLATTGAWHR
jgi:hypothetical protein